MDRIQQIRELSENFMMRNSYSGHDYEHVLRVYTLAKRIAEKEKADMSILVPAALMHDLGREKERKNPRTCHAEESAKIALKILTKVDYPKEKIKPILYTIKSHRFSIGIVPKTKEAKILQDADKLDALGAIGVMRCFIYSGSKNRLGYDPKDPLCRNKKKYDESRFSIDHFYAKLFKLKDLLHTKTAREIAKERHRFMNAFLKKMDEEIRGLS